MTQELQDVEQSEQKTTKNGSELASCPFRAEDRVKRKEGEGCLGTVQEVRSEVTATSGDTSERGLLVIVNWDNGTSSYLTPSGLESA